LTGTRERLEQELETARQELEQLEQRLETKGDYGLGEGDPLIVRWEMNLALREDMESRIEELEDALERLDQGNYGKCESCGQPIDPARLQALPQTRLCIKCARES
jgi:RNA polymerase-binding transcription factor DksA